MYDAVSHADDVQQGAHHVQAAVDPLCSVGVIRGRGDAILGDIDGDPQCAGERDRPAQSIARDLCSLHI